MLILGGGGAAWWGYAYVRRELPQFLQANLSTALGRPIKVGEFQRFSPTGVRLGPSIVPPTEDDFSWIKAKALEVNFDPLELIFTRTLRPSLMFLEPQMAAKQGFDGQWRLQAPRSIGVRRGIKTELRSVEIRNADLVVGPISRSSIVELPEGVTSATLIVLEGVDLKVRFSGQNNQTISLNLNGQVGNGGFLVRGEGQMDTRQLNLAVQAHQIRIETINPLLGGNLFIRDGILSTNLEMAYRPNAAEPLTVKGTTRLRNGDVVLTDLPSPLQDIDGTFVANGVGGRVENASLKFGSVLVEAEGTVDLNHGHNLFVTLPDVSVEQVEAALAQTLPLQAKGRFQVNTHITGELMEPQVSGKLNNLDMVRVDRLDLDTLTAQFAANLNRFILNQATIRPVTGGTITAQGEATFSQEDWRRTDITATAQTNLPLDSLAELYELPLPNSIQMGSLLADAQITGRPDNLQGLADWQLPQATFPGQGRLTYSDRRLQLPSALFQVGEGSLQATGEVSLDTLNWQAAVTGSGLGLGMLSPQLRGTLDADLQASGSLQALNLQGIQADGRVRFSHAIPLKFPGADQILPGSLNARFAWTGQRLEIPEATASKLYASGGANVAFPPQGGWPEISGMEFIARLSDLDLSAAYALVDGPQWLRPSGLVSFDGRLQGSLRDPQITGNTRLQQLAINQRGLIQDVAGPIRASLSQGAELDLRGGRAELFAFIDPSLRPNTFRFTNGEFLVEGQRQGNIFNATLHQFDLGPLALRPFDRPNLGYLSGVLEATTEIDLTTPLEPTISAQFNLEQPGLGAITANHLTGQLAYRDGLALLTGGNLQLTPDAQFLITGSGQLFPTWQARAEVATNQADIQAILQTLSLYSYGDFGRLLDPPFPGRAVDLAVNSAGAPQASLLQQATLARAMRDLGEVVKGQRTNALLPSLDQLEGQLSGKLGVFVSQPAGLSAEFDFVGQNWAWGRYDFDNLFVAQGDFHNQTLSLKPIEFWAGQTRLSLLGEVSLVDSDLTVEAKGLPLTAAANLLETPVAVTGLLSLDAHLTGSYTNPNLTGGLAIDQASINQQPFQEISSTFQYQNAYFNVDGRIIGTSPEPLLFSGTVPYALPFMTVQPASHQIALSATLKDDALALVNLLTPLLSWGGGRATIDMRVGGTLSQPLVSGLAAFNGAAFTSPVLNASLEGLTGAVNFRGNQIEVASLSGTLFDGNFELAGRLPLTPETAEGHEPGLTLTLQDLDFNFANEVRSQVNGELSLTQALLDPVLGGNVRLQNSQVVVGQELTRLANAALNPTAEIEKVSAVARRVIDRVPLHLDHLRVGLDPARVKAPPLFSFQLDGDLAVSGPVNDLYAEGGLRLLDGWVQTITTEFFLDPSYDNRAVFLPQSGLDPYLDLVLAANVPFQRNYNINRINTTTGAAEIPDIDPLGSNTVFDELLVQARVKGSASRLFENLELVSNPSYSQEQLLGMVSGGYLSNLGGAEPTLVLGSNLLSALTADTQDELGNALGLRRLRLNATTILPSNRGGTLAYGVGASVGISRNLSATLVQVLNQTQPIELNARYRINNQWGISGSTNFGNDSRVLVEYQLNF
jgi:translocation and assembly module TamB